MSKSSRSDASATYRGYRNQALYVLTRLLTDDNADHRIYRPEGGEDLAIYDSTQCLVEVVQVKDYSSDLALSHFKPSSPEGFFARFKDRKNAHPGCVTRLSSFGPLGPELRGAIAGSDPQRKTVATKIHNANALIAVVEAESMLDALREQIERPVASELHAKVLGALEGTIAGGHAPSTMELLLYWIFDASENQRDLTRAGVLLQLERIGEYLAALRDSSHEWGISVRPVAVRELTNDEIMRWKYEYRQGVQARWEHILADADSPRPERLSEIHCQLQVHRAVILRGASGQGKSSLGWRYLRDLSVDGLRFQVRLVEGREHALRVANALRAHVLRLRLRPIVYIDVSPSDVGWPELVRELVHADMKVLVTVREEDFRRANLAIGDFDYAEIVLEGVTRTEAEPIFKSLRADGASNALDFDETWARFSASDGGPLLEFTYLVTEGESLGSRIRSQIQRLQQDAATRQNGLTPAHLNMLALAAIANSADARLDLQRLCDAVGLDRITNPLAAFENEYLLRVRNDGDHALVAGLHLLRSRAVLAAMLPDGEEVLSQYATQCLALVVDRDVENYLLHVFSLYPEYSLVLESKLQTMTPRSWAHAGGIARALIWNGISAYERANRETLVTAIAKYDSAWKFVCDSFIGLSNDIHEEVLGTFKEILGGNIEPIELTPKETVFTSFRNWTSLVKPPPDPSHPSDWVSAGDVAFWIGQCQVIGEMRSALERLLPPIPTEMSIGDLAEFISGRHQLGDAAFLTWHDQHRAELATYFVSNSRSVYVADDGREVNVYFAIPLAPEAAADNPTATDWHDQAMNRVQLLRKVFPNREVYGSQGIGHEAFAGIIPNDPTVKHIPARNLAFERAVRLNAMFANLVDYRHRRPHDWATYAEAVLEFREAFSDCFHKLRKGWERLISEAVPQSKTVKNLPGKEIERVKALSKLPMFPQSAVDEWGFLSEETNSSIGSTGANVNCEQAIRRFDAWLKAFRSLESCVNRLCNMIVDQTVIYLAFRLSHSPKGEKNDMHLFLVNLASAWETLNSMQLEFRNRFGEICSRSTLERLEHHERLNFCHLWSVAFALSDERQQCLSNASVVIEAEVANRRNEFLTALRSEVGNVIGGEGAVEVLSEPVNIDRIPHLCITCNHRNCEAIEATAPRVVEAIWRAAHTKSWRPLEWTPLIIEWPKIAVVHLVRGRALMPACSALHSNVIFATDAEFEVKLYHYMALPMSEDDFTRAGLRLWNGPLLRSTMLLSTNVAAFVLTNLRFYSLATLVVKYSLGANALAFATEHFSKELNKLLNAARESYSQLLLILNTVEDVRAVKWKADLARLCALRLMAIDSAANVEINPESFGPWMDQVENSASEFNELIAALMLYSIEQQCLQ
jgi:hypothetical protein